MNSLPTIKSPNQYFQTLIKQAPLSFRENIVAGWDAAQQNYNILSHKMPAPGWRKEKFNLSGAQAWERIKRIRQERLDMSPISIYVHIPFCQGKKCGFCDCISVPIKDRTVVAKFVTILIREIQLWGRLAHFDRNPVTVVYFGGGTPNSLSDSEFEKIVQTIASEFNITPDTQIAVECPGKLLDSARLQFFKLLNISRISVGIQTLEEPLRFAIGRNTGTAQLLGALVDSKSNGFTTSGDLIYGLPDQTINGFIRSVQQLVDIGIDGLSLYRFVVSFRNQKFIQQHFGDYEKDEIFNYILFQIGHHLLAEAGYQKNHFIHFAKNDANLYYRHLLRNEDLVAIGPTADGMVGSFQYKHPQIKEYLSAGSPSAPVLQGGLMESELAQKIKPATVQLMCGEIDVATVEKFNLSTLVEKWQECHIITKTENNSYQLLANGSWLIHQLLDEVGASVA